MSHGRKGTGAFTEKLGVQNIEIERAHRTGTTRGGRPRTIVLKHLRCKQKEEILQSACKLKNTIMGKIISWLVRYDNCVQEC